MYVYNSMKKYLYLISILLVFLISFPGFGQEIRLEHKHKPGKSRSVRLDKPIMVKTFEGDKIKGLAMVTETGKLSIEGKEIILEDVMTLAGYVQRNSKEKAIGLGLTIGAGVIAVPALYYILGGIAWGLPNGIFVGATVLVFDLLLAYAGINLMGIYPKRFSTMNWNILVSANGNQVPASIPLPQPYD
jgi:hypothetical protein